MRLAKSETEGKPLKLKVMEYIGVIALIVAAIVARGISIFG